MKIKVQVVNGNHDRGTCAAHRGGSLRLFPHRSRLSALEQLHLPRNDVSPRMQDRIAAELARRRKPAVAPA